MVRTTRCPTYSTILPLRVAAGSAPIGIGAGCITLSRSRARGSSDELRPTERTNDPCSTSVVSVAALYGPPKPIAPIDPVLGISLVGHSRDVIRLFSRAAVGFPIGARLKSKTPHEGAGFIEGAPIAATTTAASKPVAPTVPPGIGIGLVGVARDVVGLFPGAAVRSPVAGRFESKALHEGAGFIEGAPIAATTTATSKPVAPTVPPGI